ncbi:MAG: hypothetical protein LBE91_12150 [Tannerella sp.]|nr:hypothetical protein [Tannerella sp.]
MHDNRQEEKYPVSLGKQTLVGKIIVKGNPCPPSDLPCVPGVVFWLETGSDDYVIIIDSHGIWASNKIIFNNNEYFEDDEVEITGEVIVSQNQFYEEYYNIEIETIKKLP